MYLLRHSQHVHREEDGAVQIWRIKETFRNISRILLIGHLDAVGSRRAAWRINARMEQKDKILSNEQQTEYARDYIAEVETGLQKTCKGILANIDKNLILSATGELQFIDEVTDIPVVEQRQIHMDRTVQRNMEIHQLQSIDKVTDVLVVLVVRVPRVQVVKETVEIPQLQLVEKIVVTPEGLITELISQLQKEALEDDNAKHSSTLETAVSRSTKADPESVNEGHTDKICDQFSDVVLDACLTCDTGCKVACETCVKDNMFMVAGEISVAGKCHHETVVRGVAQNIGIDSFIDDSSRVDRKGLHYQDCEVLFHVNIQSTCIAGRQE